MITEQCFCKSYYDDDRILQDCTCGKCEKSMEGKITNIKIFNSNLGKEEIIKIYSLDEALSNQTMQELSKDQDQIKSIINQVRIELIQANTKYGPFKSVYEALGALRLEYREVEDAIQSKDNNHTYEEAIQVAAMAIKLCMFLKK